MTGNDSEPTKLKLQILLQQASEVQERAESLQREVAGEKMAWEQAEAEVASLNRRIQSVEKELDHAQESLETTLHKLERAEKAANENESCMKVAEDQAMKDEEIIELQEIQLTEARHVAVATDKNFKEMVRMLIIEGDLEHPVERLKLAESFCLETDEQDRLMDQNLKSQNAAEEKYFLKEDTYEKEIKILTNKLKAAETRAEFAENLTAKMGKTISDLENKLKCSKEEHSSTQKMLAQTLLDLNEM